jgi:DnaJ-domain-containing protein 1
VDKTKINDLVETGDKYINSGMPITAYEYFEQAIGLLFASNIRNKRSKSIGSIAGWTAGLMTGGLGIEDIFIIPGVSKGVSTLLGVDEKYINSMLQAISLRQIDCILSANELTRNISPEIVLQKYTILYLSIGSRSVTKVLVDYYIPELAQNTPFDHPEAMQAAYAFLLEQAKSNNDQLKEYELLLLSYLRKIKNDSELYKILSERHDHPNSYSGRKDSNEQGAHSPNDLNYYYEVLGIKMGATKEEIRKAYMNLIKLYHPDRFASLSAEFQELAKSRAQLLNEAYEILMK